MADGEDRTSETRRQPQVSEERDQAHRDQEHAEHGSEGRPAIDQLLERVRRGLARVGPAEAAEIHARGGMLVDTRPVELRHRHGTVPGAVIVDRNQLEWRLDPTSPHRLAEVKDADLEIVLFCQEGYASSLAAAVLKELGLTRATDLDGGFVAWAAAGLPVERAVEAPAEPLRADEASLAPSLGQRL